ncbi:MAG: lipoyl synthase [Lentisphaeria bacterium]|nr:lipoyl synthase [Lentisphaeria bacterium]
MSKEVNKRIKRERLPEWIRVKVQPGKAKDEVDAILKNLNLNTVCREAGCPNLHECWQKRTATFMIMGSKCTRSCRFCAVGTDRAPLPLDPNEPLRIAQAAFEMKLKFVVLTSVTRDDLDDGGAEHFAATIREIKKLLPEAGIEVLTPDFNGIQAQLYTVLDAGPTVFNHNLETVRRMTPEIRNRATYEKSLMVLKMASEYPNRTFLVKSGLMVGVGETDDEIYTAIQDLRENGVELLTIGQYLPPNSKSYALDRYVDPTVFEDWQRFALKNNFKGAVCGPLVRSSYMAEDLVR